MLPSAQPPGCAHSPTFFSLPLQLACPAKSHLHHGCWREDQSQNQEESARQGTSGTYHQRADAVVLSEHQHPRLPPHRGVPWPPPAPALDSVHAHSRGPHFLAVCPPHLILLHRLCLHQSPLPEAGFSCCHHLQHQSLQVRGRSRDREEGSGPLQVPVPLPKVTRSSLQSCFLEI